MNIQNAIHKAKLLGCTRVKILSDNIVITAWPDGHKELALSWEDEVIDLGHIVRYRVQNKIEQRHGILTIFGDPYSYIIDTFHHKVSKVDKEITGIYSEVGLTTIYSCRVLQPTIDNASYIIVYDIQEGEIKLSDVAHWLSRDYDYIHFSTEKQLESGEKLIKRWIVTPSRGG